MNRKDFSDIDKIEDYWKNNLIFMIFVIYSLFIIGSIILYLITKLGIILYILSMSSPFVLAITAVALLMDKRNR